MTLMSNKGRPATATLALAMSAYLSLYPALLLPPLILLSYDSLLHKKPALSVILSLTVRSSPPHECDN